MAYFRLLVPALATRITSASSAKILVTVFACNALGDALRDVFDPRQLPRGITDATFASEA